VLELQDMASSVTVDDSLMQYIVDIANATRNSDQIQVGVSPRGSLALTSVAKATALVNGRDFLVPEDITDNIIAVCSHRIMARSHMHDGSPVTTERVLQQVMETVQAPA
ncbi:MAG: AAA family ATPase, partial [Planctomycetota bacterium]|jgi:MoxR-like ATPase